MENKSSNEANFTQEAFDQLVDENARLRLEIAQLQLQCQLSSSSGPKVDVGIQTDKEVDICYTSSNTAADWRLGPQENALDFDGVSVADMVRSAAEQTVTEQQLPGFELQPDSGLYYSQETGYYYDPKSTLFYHPSTQSYYYYDEHSQQYRVYDGQQQDEPSFPASRASKRRHFRSSRYRKLASRYGYILNQDDGNDPDVLETVVDLLDMVEIRVGTRRPKRTYLAMMSTGAYAAADDDPEILEEIIDLTEDGECSTSDSSSSDSSCEFWSSDEEVQMAVRRRKAEKESSQYPPCIRLMEFPGATLHIVTITGAVIGRIPNCEVQLNGDDLVSRTHAKITYNEAKRRYYVEDLQSSHGTLLNDERLETTARLRHGDWIRMGGKTLSVHLHAGSNTCSGCEPGLASECPANQVFLHQVSAANGSVMEENDVECLAVKRLSKANKERMRRAELRQLKKRFGLQGMSHVDAVLNPAKYVDRASNRRRTEGSQHDSHNPDAIPASVNRAISAENKGFKMLSKMGWKEGTSLGKSAQGITEPIAPSVHLGNAGLGSGAGATVSMDEVHHTGAKRQLWLKTQQRYRKTGLVHPQFLQEDAQAL